eukprot:3341678-Amphidinium_carterae.1
MASNVIFRPILPVWSYVSGVTNAKSASSTAAESSQGGKLPLAAKKICSTLSVSLKRWIIIGTRTTGYQRRT